MFKELKYYQKGNEYYFDRDNIENEHYISACSALSFHKSLIGLSELNALEKQKQNVECGGLRLSRTINTYYIVFHLFISLMLLDKTYEIKIKKRFCSNGHVDFGVDFESLCNTSELPDTWNEFKYYEQDLSTLFDHRDIKAYCDDLRRTCDLLKEPYISLYKEFIQSDINEPNKSIPGLYEKLCYIRDRAIYRPSVVIDRRNGGYIQTSLDVRKEIESLPNYNNLYNIIMRIYTFILSNSREQGRNINRTFLLHLWSTNISESREYLYSLGYSDTDIDEIRFMKEFLNTELSFGAHVIHLIELCDRERVLNDLENIWGKLFKMTISIDTKDENSNFN